MKRQGDVLIIPISSLPSKLTPIPGAAILARGEATGHHHAVRDVGAALFHNEAGVMFLQVSEAGATLTHEEHGAIQIEAGAYEVRIQREFVGGVSRRVED